MFSGAQRSARPLRDFDALTRALRNIASVISQSPDFSHVLQVVMDEIEVLFPVEAGSLLLLDEGKGELRFERALGSATARVAPFRLRVGQGIAGWVVEQSKPLLVPDVQEDPRFYRSVDQLSGFRTRSILCVPLMVRGRAIGAIELINKVEGAFTEEDLELLEILAGPAAIAIESAANYARLRQQIALLNSMHTLAAGLQSSRSIEEATATYIRGAQDLGFTWVEVYLVSRDQQHLEPGSYAAPPDLLESFTELLGSPVAGLPIPLHGRSPYSALLSGRVLATDTEDAALLQGQPVFLVDLLRSRFWPEDPRWSRTALVLGYIPQGNWLAFPVKAEGRVLGALILARGLGLTREDASFLQTFVGLLGQTLDRLQAEERIRRRNRELTTLIEASAAMAASLEAGELLEAVARQVTTASSLDACWISDWEPTSRQLIRRLQWSRKEGKRAEDLLEAPFSFRQVDDFPLIRQVLETRLAQAVHVAETPLHEQEAAFLAQQGWRLWVLLPMVVHGQVIGLIELGDPSPHPAFGMEEMRLCCVLAEHAAVALQNARLFAAEASVAEQNARLLEAARFRTRQLEVINEVARATSSVLRLDALTELATELIQKNLGYPYVALALVEGDALAVHVRGPHGTSRRRQSRTEGVLGWVASRGEPLVLPNARTDPRFQSDPEMPGALSELALPLLWEGEVVGVLDLRSPQLEAFTAADLHLLSPLADQLAISIGHARLFALLSKGSGAR
ncbi:MAG: GAF domain-containing protein [Anaerolineae bacterium]